MSVSYLTVGYSMANSLESLTLDVSTIAEASSMLSDVQLELSLVS